MEVSSSTGSTAQSSAPIEALKKAEEVQERAITKVLESANEQSQQVAAQKTGVGNSINLTA